MCLMRFLELLPHNSVTFSNLVEGFYAPGEHRCDVCYCTVIGSQFCISCGVSDRSFVFLRGFGVRNVFLLLFRLEWSSQRIGTVKKCLAFF